MSHWVTYFFNPKDFETKLFGKQVEWPKGWQDMTDIANQKLINEGIQGFAQQHRGQWTFTERQMMGDTHRAILLNLEALKPCTHEKEKVMEKFGGRMQDQFDGYECECGAEVEPAGFVEKKK